ncbi:MAG: hypothetical protein FWB96_04590 [Defluviitaleaceae bacterium]|nr:hypothetical protein [Defluviitaleaceae bacterium]MCL2262660.1 hypothetical protein [Defluviitaleaceae bacterium]
MKCEVGDIVLVNNFKYQDGSDGSLHSFVVVDITKDEFEIVNLDYVCFLISSNVSKNSDVNPSYPYNEPIEATGENGLKKRGHVKCDYLFEKIKEEDIFMRVGTITAQQYRRFMELYQTSLM